MSEVAEFLRLQALGEESAQLGLYGLAAIANHEAIQKRIDQGFAVIDQLFKEGKDDEAWRKWNGGILERGTE